MTKKMDLELVRMAMRRAELEPEKIEKVERTLINLLRAEEEEQGEKAPPVKKQFGIVISDPDGILTGKDFTGWIVQIPEDESITSCVLRIHKAAYAFNATPKGRRMPVGTIGEACEVIPPKIFKEEEIWIKTKIPVLVTACPNELVTE